MTAATDYDGWVKLAMNEDVAVVDVLLRLRHAQPPPPSNRSHGVPSLRWSVRQRRSRNVPRHHHADDDVVEAKINNKKKDESSGARASPATPLSWSGATSVSGGGAADGSEESSKPTKPTDAARSKVAVRSETTILKRPRKKKTLAELKEEESLLLQERRNLKYELESLCLTIEKERAINESLKKMELEVQLQQQTVVKVTTSAVSGEPVWHQSEQVTAVDDPTTIMPTSVHCNNVGASQSSCLPNVSCKVEVGSLDAAFSLPDLNIPFGDDPNSEVLYGISWEDSNVY